MVKLTQHKLKYFIGDERKAIKEYKKYGLKRLARDEARHLHFLKKLRN
jgi:hypothetical protein